MNANNKTIIEIANLRKSFVMRDSEINILKGINIKVKQGEFAIIFGPSGCGKSTLLHCILGLEEKQIMERAKKNLELIGMDKWSNYMPNELSGGQQQKVTLARALSIDPLMIVADEPTGNLDTVSGRELLETFLKLINLGKTIVMVTHDLEYLKYATKIYHMLDGEVVEEIEVNKKTRSKMINTKKKITRGEVNSCHR